MQMSSCGQVGGWFNVCRWALISFQWQSASADFETVDLLLLIITDMFLLHCYNIIITYEYIDYHCIVSRFVFTRCYE